MSSGKIETSGYFQGIADLQKYGILTTVFSSRILTPVVNSPKIIKQAK
jgi:hypothetical protein